MTDASGAPNPAHAHHVHARQFCHDVMLERGEPLEGAAGTAPERVLLLYWPHGKWRVPRFESRDMSPQLSEAIRVSMVETKLPVMLVDRRLSDEDVPTLLCMPEGIVSEPEDEAELIAMIAAAGRGERLPGRRDDRIVILACTDGKRDPCCARWGFSTYKALIAAADPQRFNILETTHQGGCRVAASLTVQPSRERYGRLTPEQVPEFLDAIAAGRKYLPAIRGRGGISEAAMIAEIAALRWAEERGIDQSQVSLPETDFPEPAEAKGVLRVEAVVGGTRLFVDLESRELLLAGHCEALDHGAGGKPTFRWVQTGLGIAEPERLAS